MDQNESFDEDGVNFWENCVGVSENIDILVNNLDSEGVPTDGIDDGREKSFEEQNQQQVNVEIEGHSSLISNLTIASAESTKHCVKKVPVLLPISKNDYQAEKVIANNAVHKPVLFNNFCPFWRLPNVPFSIRGRPRKRSKSVDFYASIPPPLETIFESEEEYAQSVMQPNGNHRNFQANDGHGYTRGEYFGHANVKGLIDGQKSELNSIQTPKTLAVVQKWIGNLDNNQIKSMHNANSIKNCIKFFII